MVQLPKGWRVAHERDPEMELQKLRLQLSKITDKYEKRILLQRRLASAKSLGLTLAAGLLAGGAAVYFGVFAYLLHVLPENMRWLVAPLV